MANFYLDNDVPLRLAALLAAMGHSATTARHENRTDAEDHAQLLFAAENKLSLVSHNARDYSLLHKAWLDWSKAWNVQPVHAGILIIPQLQDLNALAWKLNEIAGYGMPLWNELYEWHSTSGWKRCI